VNAARKNLWTAGISAGVCAILIAAITLLSIDSSNDFINRRPSTFFTDRTGTRAILLVLQKMLPATDQWRRPFNELPSPTNSARSTLIVMSPEDALTESEVAVLDRWITSGGQLILATNKEWRIRKPRRSTQFAKKNKEEDDYLPQGYLARHGLLAKADVSGEAAIAAAASQKLGAGRILLVSDPYAFSNEALRTTDNAVWIAARTSEWADTVFIDEYHHGFGEKRELLPLIGMFLMSPWGFVGMQLALAGIVYILGSKRRFGRPIEELPVERTSPIEAVEALGGLFETARARVLSVRTIHQYLNIQLTALFGYAIDISNPAIRDRIAGRSSLSRSELDSYAEAVKHAVDGASTSDAELIRIARDATSISRSFSYGSARQSSGRPAAAG
jgi:hypothetical protein